jgi:hypothetical protein
VGPSMVMGIVVLALSDLIVPIAAARRLSSLCC